MEKQEVIVMYPSPAIGHLVSMVELAKLILSHYPSLSIDILVPHPPYQSSSTTEFISTVSATIPTIAFHNLPQIFLPPETTSLSPHHEILTFETLRLSCPHVHKTLMSLTKRAKVLALVMDFFCMPALDIAYQLNIPGYYFLTSGAGFLACLAHLPTIHANTTKSFKELNQLLDIPGLPPIPSSDMVKPWMERNDKAYEYFLEVARSLSKASGIIVNTFESLEARALKALSNSQCPPVYCLGPLISERGTTKGFIHECMTWLDTQPAQSVVFLCFGSLGLFTEQQLHEIAKGLEHSNQRFLWVVRSPSPENQEIAISSLPEPELSVLLPEGFLERTKDRGLVVKSWAPQVSVLRHLSVGGFVTHCGWNSVLEAVHAGVPMVAWPLYAEQRLNRVLMVEEMKIALRLNEREDGFVSADEVEKKVRELMECEEGQVVRERLRQMNCKAKKAMTDEGSSMVALEKLVKKWRSV